jgi:hypothetical protein
VGGRTIQRHEHHLISLTGICKKQNTNNINKISTSNKINGSKDEQNIYNICMKIIPLVNESSDSEVNSLKV